MSTAEFYGGPKDGWVMEFPGACPYIFQFPMLPSYRTDLISREVKYDVIRYSFDGRRYVYEGIRTQTGTE